MKRVMADQTKACKEDRPFQGHVILLVEKGIYKPKHRPVYSCT